MGRLSYVVAYLGFALQLLLLGRFFKTRIWRHYAFFFAYFACTVVSNVRPNFGDYIGSDIAGDTILAVWADGRNGVPDTFFAPIFF